MGISFKKIWNESKVLGEGNLILVIVGLMYGFENLIQEMDKIAGKIDETVVMQIGNTSYEPKKAKYFRFISEKEIDGLYNDARIVVCHAGVGSILTALQHNKPIIAVPRKKKYGEHIDDHQIEIAREWEKEGKIIAVYNIDNLEKTILNFSQPSEIKIKNGTLIRALTGYLEELSINK